MLKNVKNEKLFGNIFANLKKCPTFALCFSWY